MVFYNPTRRQAPPAIEPLEPRLLLSGGLVISEFLANNDTGLPDEDGEYRDWIEIHNTGPAAVNVDGWFLTDDDDDLTRWALPAVSIPGGGYLLVFASDKDRDDPNSELHTNFKLDADGEYLALVRPDGAVEHEYAPAFPEQIDDVSYGIGVEIDVTALVAEGAAGYVLIPPDGVLGDTWRMPDPLFNTTGWQYGPMGVGYDTSPVSNPGQTHTFIEAGAPAWAFVPANDSLGASWRQAGFNHSSWQSGVTGVGFERDFGYDSMIGLDVEPAMFGVNASCYIRVPFEVDDPDAFASLTLQMKFDDGFAAYINGTEVCSVNVPDPVTWNAGAPASSAEAGATWNTYDITAYLGLLVEGTNVLAIQGLNRVALNGDFLIVPRLEAVTSDTAYRYEDEIATDVEAEMADTRTSAYMRIPFTVDEGAAFDSLTLRMKYDDGFVAWLNGTEVARRNAPATPAWDSAATADRPDADAVVFEEFDLTPFAHLLVEGENILAVQGLNVSASDSDFLISAELLGRRVTLTAGRYFTNPTPGEQNDPGSAGLVGDITFSHERGFYEASFALTLTSELDGATIRYTLDGSWPSDVQGTVYTGPIPITTTTILRAVAHKPGYLTTSEDVETHTYLFLADVLNQVRPPGYPTGWGENDPHLGYNLPSDFDMDPQIVYDPDYVDEMIPALLSIPTISIVTDHDDMFDPDTGIYMNAMEWGVSWERAASVEYFTDDGGGEFHTNCGVRIQGGYSRRTDDSPKHSFRLLFKDIYGPTKLRFPLFGEGATDTFDGFVLRAGFNNSWIHDNESRHYGARERSQYIRDQWAKDTQMAMGQLAPHNNYAHLYINGLYWGLYNPTEPPDASFTSTYLGGGKGDYDVLNSGDVVDGSAFAWDELFSLANGGLSGQAQYQAICDVLDVVAFTDYMILHQYGGNTDWDSHNWYAYRRREPGGKWYFVSWDSEYIFNNLTDNQIALNYDRPPGRLFTALTANPEYRMLLADRIHELLFDDGLLTPASVLERWNLRAEEVYDALPAESARWGDYRRDVDPGGGPTPIPVYERDVHWQAERNRLTNSYFPQRTGIVIGQYRSAGLYPSVAAPTLNQHGGAVAPGFALTMSSGSATTYYTLDGTDPRREGGAISPDALVYTGAVTLNDNAHVMARARTGAGTWSALTETSFAVGDSPIRVTEIMFNALVGALDGDEYEFVEVHNPSGSSVFLGGMRLAGGVDFLFPDVDLPAGGRVLLVRNHPAFASRYPAAASMVVGAYAGNLSDGGETIRLDDAAGRAVLTIDYSDWYEVTDGAGWSLTLREESVPVAELSLASSWRPSEYAGGSPGTADWDVTPGSVVINELLAHGEGLGDWIELHNTTAGSVDIGGWGLSDSDQDPLRYRFPAGTILSPGEHRVFSQVQFGFGLSEHGEAVYLTGADADGTLRGYRDGQAFGSSPNGSTFGRYDTSVGTDFVLLESATPGAANAGPLVGPVVINEIMYHPADGGDEFIELHNISDEDVKLYDAAWPDHTWTLDGAVEYEFPAGVVIPAGGFVVLVGEGVQVAAFRAAHGVPADVAILGGYSGSLDNAGESVKLYAPGVPDAGTGFYSYVRIDRVRYDDEAPWPEGADGPGPSLARLIAGAYGNDPVNWLAGLAGGTPGRANVVEAGPALAASLGSSATLSGAYVAGSLPGAAVTPAWSLVSGPGAVTFADPASAATTATFRAVGTYVLRLTVSDGQYAAWDELRVDVSGLMGDANGDGDVGIADLVALAQHYGDLNASWSDGDFNGDGTVGIADLVALADHYGDSVGGATPAGGAARSEEFALPDPIPALPAGEISALAAIAPIAPDIPPLLPAADAPAPADAPASTRAAAEDDADTPLADLDPIPDLLAQAVLAAPL